VSLLYSRCDDESEVEMLFQQRSQAHLRAGRFTMDFGSRRTEPFKRIASAAGSSLILILFRHQMPE